MKRLRRRLIFHFSMQFLTLLVTIIILVFALLFLLLQYITDQEQKRNGPAGVLEALVTETNIEDDSAELDEKKWRHSLRKRGLWMQIVNHQGKVIKSSNAPADLPQRYSVNDLLQVEKNQRFLDYKVLAELDHTYDKPYVFLVGYKDQLPALQHLVAAYSDRGRIKAEKRQALEGRLKPIDGTLHIINPNGDIIEAFGKPLAIQQYKPLDILSNKQMPGIHSTSISVQQVPAGGYTWVLHTPKKKDKIQSITVMEEYILGFGLVGFIALLITLLLSFWNGFRYGRPLFLFTGWLKRMEQGKYDEVLTKKERKKIFRKNGKVKARYRLYREVINAFYNMTEKLDESVKERAKLEKTREEWMTGISHDLRTPLSTIQGYGHLLESGHYQWTAEELKEVGQTIREKGEYMLHLIEDFSLTFQLKNNRLVLSKEICPANHLLKAIVDKFILDRTLSDYRFHFHPATDRPLIEADRKWFERMMDNILFNAIKHNPSGTAITVRIIPSAEYVTIQIEDTGVGMDEETVNKLFDRYYRGTNTEERIEGAGLGMNIARQIALLHDASVTVHSELGQGTTVAIQLPRTMEDSGKASEQ
ncbi:sensor histidine kinase [Bacillus xiapuensis]|uniref:sensor histidine kinase n=1 Tax=Bacillus xiapuensis TaxID=2014075 RepID=UPI000C24848B|nr:HAMP domain-containing sensor histidine kinase [Bacillus xiapuensis]